MLRTNILSITLLSICVIGAAAIPCPSPNYLGNVYSAQIVAALDGGVIPFSDGEDTQCYNYSLPYAFNTVPDVAVAVHSFEAEASNNLFFFIKPIHSESLSFLPFVIRTQWPYTQWNQITFSFLAEDRSDVEAGYYQIDSGPLSGCENGKMIDVLLPFRRHYKPGQQIQHSVFLHGFEIATVKTEGNTRSPFEFQIISTTSNISGIAITISVTTTTQVNSVYISFVAFQQSVLAIIGGAYVFDATVDEIANGLYHSPETVIPRNYARLYGITGFLLNYSRQRISFNSRWDGFSFNFVFGADQKLLKYLSFGYIFFTGSECQDCSGYEIFDNGACIAFCPAGSAKTPENTCINCGTGREWNGTVCITSCSKGQYLNTATGLCECPPTLNWNGESCIPCLSGKVWSANSKTCECPKPLVWNGFACAKIDPCVGGKVWDVYTYSCQCPDTSYWTGEECKYLPQCPPGQTLNSKFECSCPVGYIWSQNLCIYSPCTGGQVWTGSKCVCPVGLNYNGRMCVECINGQKWDTKTSACACESGFKWNGQFCEKSYSCSNGRVWSPVYNQCICPDGSYWGGYNCLPLEKCNGGQYFDTTLKKCACLSGYQWDGRSCIQCTNGRAWNVTTISCTCPPGTVEIKNGCRLQQQCTGGKEWNQNSWTCECPLNAVWNGVYCIANICQPGQKWNETARSCYCPGGKVLINQMCVPPQIVCTNGRVWNQYLYACTCPPNTFPTAATCDPLPVCSFGKVYNPLNNQCQCPFGLAQRNSVCVDPKCGVGQYYNNGACQVINCPPPSFFRKDRCHYGDSSQCGFGYHWDGAQCIYYPSTCPPGTTWTGSNCQNSGSCGDGFWSDGGNCAPFPQQCTPPTRWDGTKCSAPGNLCPKGTYAQGDKCFPYEGCKNGFVWDAIYLRCVCPPGLINSGNRCVECSNDQKWIPSVGCACPDGSFDTGASCEYPTPSKCKVIANAIWSDNKCLCRPGFTKAGLQCICYGTQVGDFCDKCSYKPNSKLNELSNTCECKDGFTEVRGFCVPNGNQPANENPNSCAVGTYFDQNQRACLACPDGCLSCSSCYTCNVCRPGFIYDPSCKKCFEICGDGKRFSLECDDGNNEDGDGCSRDCKIEQGFNCTGGSPDFRDSCVFYRPEKLRLTQIGQIRKSTSLVLNFRLNYLPNSLLQSQDCNNKCSQILVGTITSGDRSAVSITSEYLSGTRYFFTMTVEFGRSYMAKFTLNVSVNSALQKYFGGIGVEPLQITVQPAYLMSVGGNADYA